MSQSDFSPAQCGAPWPWLARSRAWVSILLLTPAAIAAVFSQAHAGLDSWGDYAFEFSGWLFFFIGAGFRWWATLYVGGRKSGQLVTTGAYSVTRNPIYFGTFLMSLSVGILIQSVSFLACLALTTLYYLAVTIYVEEQKLLNLFGAAFVDYCDRVPRLVPNFGIYQSPSAIEVRVEGLYAEWLRTLRWIWIPLACHFIMHLRTQPWWPQWFALP